MLKGKVIGNIVSTNKLDKLIGYKFLEIRLIENNEIQHFRIGTKIRIPKQCLIDYLNKRGAQGESSC